MTDWKCKKCGSSERYGRACAPCAKLRAAKHRALNPEKTRSCVRKWNAENKDAKKQSDKNWRARKAGKENAPERIYKERNKEAERAASLAFYYRNRDVKIAYQTSRYAANPEKVKDYIRKRRLENPEIAVIASSKRRARKLNNGGVLSRGIVKKLYTLQDGKCACCGKPLGEKYHLDHIMPLSLGGENSDRNVQLLLPICNMSKGSKHPDVYRRECENRALLV